MGIKADRRTFLKLSSGAGAAALGGLSAGQARAESGQTLTLAWDTDIDSLDPHVFKSVGGYAVQCNIYDPIVSWKVRPVEGTVGLSRSFPNEFEGSIAQSWTFERDGATVVLKIRPGMIFPSGRPVNAAALKYSLDRALQSPGYMRFVMPRMLQISKPDDIEVRDDNTVAINMKGPTPQPMVLNLLSLMTITALDPELVKPNATEKDPWAADWAKRNPAGSGPYTLAANTPGVEVVLEARKDHWRGVPAFQKVVFKFVPNEADRVLLLKRKAVDLVVGRPGLSPRSIKTFEGDKTFKIVSVPDTTCHWLAMNQTKKPLDNVKVRQAINYAIPVAAIVPNVLMGYGAAMTSPVPALTPGHDGKLSPYKFNLDKAKELMKEAGVTTPVTLDLAVRIGWQPHEEAAVWIQRELEKIGFKINITRQTDATFRQLASKGDLQLSIESWQSWVNDPFFHLVPLFHSTSKGTNTAFYANPKLDKLLDENYHEPNADKRLAAAQEAQRIVIEDAVWGMLWYDNWTRVMRADLAGIEKRWDTFERFTAMKLA
ncbi:MAG TPA: ABC transporter substrate-binding protein [Reyranella sp.]|nr:ABC transporter substrate-binding protein [Reyranella sp.]